MDAALEFGKEVLEQLPYNANEQQVAVVAALARFLTTPQNPLAPPTVFLLNGYAGTGKTSLTGALVNVLEAHNTPVMLLAPTGRAAKVFSLNAKGHPAYTIHRKIYRHALGGAPGAYSAPLPAENKHRDTVFIVDEASMIGAGDDNGGNLLEDLITYVYAGDGCRLILIGDTAQLPPVGADISPAMNPEALRALGLRVTRATMTATARQARDSGILYNATRLRRVMAELNKLPADAHMPVPHLRLEGFPDVRAISGEELPDILTSAYDNAPGGAADTILITRSNRRAAEYNAAIRGNVLYREEEISAGDMLIVARNHYFTRKVPGIDFVANGDIVTVDKVYGTEVRYGLHFADVRLSMPPAPWTEPDTEPPSFDVKIILDTLSDPEATISRESYSRLYYGVINDNERYGDMPVEQRLNALRTDPYWNALIVKYAYAITCHKAQGGQWDNVFIDLSYIPDDALGMNLYRWFYTALTRARRRLYLINPAPVLLGKRAEEDL